MYQLAGMVECYQLDRETVLPEYPTHVTNEEISYCDGVDDYGRFRIGCLFEPKFPDVPEYMQGWNWAAANYDKSFISEVA